MRTPTGSLAALLLPASAVLLGAGKPTPPAGSFVPAVGYRYSGPTTSELRLGDASGSAAVLLHRSAGSIGGFDLAPASLQAAVLIESTGVPSDRLVLRSWSQASGGGALTVAPPVTLYESRSLLFPDFSPDGSKVAVAEWDGTGNLHSLRVIDVATGAISTIASGVDSPGYLRWSSTGDALYYASQHPVTGQAYTSAYTAYRHPVDGSPRQVMFEKPNIERWDISRDGSDSLILNYSAPETGSAIPFAIWNGTSLTQVYSQLIGVGPHYSCGNTRMIYQSYSKTGIRGPIKVFTPSTGSDVVYTKDQNVGGADWIPCG